MHGCFLRCWASAVLLAVAPSIAAAAAISPVSQNRSILAETEFSSVEFSDFDTQNDQAVGFGLFNSSVAASVKAFDPNTGPEISSSAWQNSEILTGSIFGDGASSAQSELGTGNGTGNSSSLLTAEFSLVAAATYNLTGSLDAASQFTGSASTSLVLTGPGGTVYSLSTTGGLQPIISSGPLVAGTYTLTVSSISDIVFAEDTASAAFDFVLTIVPEPALGALALAVGLFGACPRRLRS